MPSILTKRRWPKYTLLATVCLLVGCASVNPYCDATKKYHRTNGFNNNYIDNWGAFRLCDDAIDAPIDELPKARKKLVVADDAFVLFALGETRVLRRGLKP